MSNTANGSRRAEQHAQRLAFLRDHPELLRRLPSAGQDVSAHQSTALDEALRMMKFVRLYAPTSAADNVRWGIRLLVSELRGEVVKDMRFKSAAW